MVTNVEETQVKTEWTTQPEPVEERVEDGIYEKKLEYMDLQNLLERQYINTQVQFFKLNLMLDDPAKFRKLKLTLAYEDVAARIANIRAQTNFAKDLLRYQKKLRLP